MSDKYEEAGKKYIAEVGLELNFRPFPYKMLADAFRWYDEHREKEVCEWVIEDEDDGIPLAYRSSCGEWYHVPEDAISGHDAFCPHCGRRIKEVPSD